jgi:hypothetical protein
LFTGSKLFRVSSKNHVVEKVTVSKKVKEQRKKKRKKEERRKLCLHSGQQKMT